MARRLKVEEVDSTVFSLAPFKGGPNNGSRVAPGMEVSFVLKFSPDALADHACDIVCLSDREKFVIPVHAIGARGTSLSIGKERSMQNFSQIRKRSTHST